MREIEHRYLLKALPPVIDDIAFTVCKAKNVYIVTDTIQERFTKRIYRRHPKYTPGTKLYRRTVKIGHGIERLEFKDKCDVDLYKSMRKVSGARKLKKVRYRVAQKLDSGEKFVWEVDTFLDRKLFLAEVEVPEVDTPVFVPRWLEPFIEREITEEHRYEGCNLAL